MHASIATTASPSGVAFALPHLARLLVVLLPLEVGENSRLLNLPLEAAEHAVEIVPFVDRYLNHSNPFSSQKRDSGALDQWAPRAAITLFGRLQAVNGSVDPVKTGGP